MNESIYIIFFFGALIWTFWTFFKGFGPDKSWKGNRIRVLLLVGFALVGGHILGGVTGSANQEASAVYRQMFLKKYIAVLRESGSIVRGSAEMARVIASPEFKEEVRNVAKPLKNAGDVLFYVSMVLVFVQLILLYPHKKIPVQKQIFYAKFPVIPLFLMLFAGKMLATCSMASTARLNTEGRAAAVILTQEIPEIPDPEASFDNALHILEQEVQYERNEQLLPPADYILALYPAAVLSDGTRAIARHTPQVQIHTTLAPAGWSAIVETEVQKQLKRWIIPLPDPEKGGKYSVRTSGDRFIFTDGRKEYHAVKAGGLWNMVEPASQTKGK